MTGTGTQTDPYIVDNWTDFASVASSSEKYIKFADGGGVIDMNDEAPNGISYSVISSSYVDGNGWIIKNLYNKNNSFTTGGSISNISFLNVYSESEFIYNTSLYKCVVSGKFGSEFFSTYYKKSVDRCSFNIICFGTNGYLTNTHNIGGEYAVFNHCKINISNASSYYKKFRYANFYNCAFTGETNQTETLFDSNNLYYSVLDVEAPDIDVLLSNASSICIANTEKAPNMRALGNWRGVTTAQMSDAEYLASIGFPIGVD